MTQSKDWFVDWFDSPYYHILYRNRDDIEAKKFILNLNKHLNPKPHSKLIDVACGKGRHSVFMAELGYDVHGFDLSKNNIIEAKKNQKENLSFFINDIRTPLNHDYYNYAFNLFTSFGYFESLNDNQKAINAISDSLKTKGKLVLDFMNCSKVINDLTKSETVIIDNIIFNIKRSYNNGFIIKDIKFSDKGENYNYQERVKAISLSEFKDYFENARLKIENVFGNYNLDDFNVQSSDRLIIIAEKP